MDPMGHDHLRDHYTPFSQLYNVLPFMITSTCERYEVLPLLFFTDSIRALGSTEVGMTKKTPNVLPLKNIADLVGGCAYETRYDFIFHY